MLAAVIHLMRGTPYIYQGEEIGMTNPHFQQIDQYRDVESLNYYEILLERGKTREEALAVLAARSRDNSRTPMQWTGEEQGGFTHGTPWIETGDNYDRINVESQINDPDSVYSFYKELIRLRREKAVISRGTIQFFEEENLDVLAYRRRSEGCELVVLANLTAGEAAVKRREAWNGYEKLLGNYEGVRGDGEKIVLRPFEAVALERAAGSK